MEKEEIIWTSEKLFRTSDDTLTSIVHTYNQKFDNKNTKYQYISSNISTDMYGETSFYSSDDAREVIEHKVKKVAVEPLRISKPSSLKDPRLSRRSSPRPTSTMGSQELLGAVKRKVCSTKGSLSKRPLEEEYHDKWFNFVHKRRLSKDDFPAPNAFVHDRDYYESYIRRKDKNNKIVPADLKTLKWDNKEVASTSKGTSEDRDSSYRASDTSSNMSICSNSTSTSNHSSPIQIQITTPHSSFLNSSWPGPAAPAHKINHHYESPVTCYGRCPPYHDPQPPRPPSPPPSPPPPTEPIPFDYESMVSLPHLSENSNYTYDKSDTPTNLYPPGCEGYESPGGCSTNTDQTDMQVPYHRYPRSDPEHNVNISYNNEFSGSSNSHNINNNLAVRNQHVPVEPIREEPVPMREEPIRDRYEPIPREPIRDRYEPIPMEAIRDRYEPIPMEPIRDRYEPIPMEPTRDNNPMEPVQETVPIEPVRIKTEPVDDFPLPVVKIKQEPSYYGYPPDDKSLIKKFIKSEPREEETDEGATLENDSQAFERLGIGSDGNILQNFACTWDTSCDEVNQQLRTCFEHPATGRIIKIFSDDEALLLASSTDDDFLKILFHKSNFFPKCRKKLSEGESLRNYIKENQVMFFHGARLLSRPRSEIYYESCLVYDGSDYPSLPLRAGSNVKSEFEEKNLITAPRRAVVKSLLLPYHALIDVENPSPETQVRETTIFVNELFANKNDSVPVQDWVDDSLKVGDVIAVELNYTDDEGIKATVRRGWKHPLCEVP